MEDTPDCSVYIGTPGRLFCLMFLFFYFRNHQPLNSRKYAPLLSTIGLTLNLIAETIKFQFDYETIVHNGCYLSFYINYPLFFLP
jgi:hypothetical protein